MNIDNSMNWEKKGLIYTTNGSFGWNKSHAQIPTVDISSDAVWRIYYSARDAENRSYTSYIEVEAGSPSKVLYEHNEPILPLGELGTFDDCGIMPSWIINHGGKKYLYYIGWNIKKTIPYYNSIGLAVSDDDGMTFKKFSKGPIIDRNSIEPHFTGTSCVLVENGVWKNWYLSCTKWDIRDGKPEPFYHIKYAESPDGINWIRNGAVAIDYRDSAEGGIARASVIREREIYKMWYCYRAGFGYRDDKSKSYRIGYAESDDGKIWRRLDQSAGIDVSDNGWDSKMIAYPHVIVHDGIKYMFYNGNDFGKTGFGYAVLGD